MRLQLSRRRAWSVVALACTTTLVGLAHAEDRVTVRGAYYREASTRVIQPVVEVSKDLPGGVDLTATYLLDAITSASVAAGVVGDATFTELRNDVGLAVGWNRPRGRLSLGYRYSAESDFWSHSVGFSEQFRLWEDAATLAVNFGLSFDGAWPRIARTPDCETNAQLICRSISRFFSVGYSLVINRQLLAQVTGETTYMTGYLASLYRAVPNHGFENLPTERLRLVASPRVAYYVIPSRTSLQLQYRFYHDDWGLNAHMVEGVVHQELGQGFEVRLSYRFYTQTPADFWCDWMARPECYGQAARIYTGEPQLQHVATSMPEVKVIWDAFLLRGVPFFGWFSEGTFAVSYARFIQNTNFGNAHLLQMGYTLPY